MLERWGTGFLGSEDYFFALVRATRALDVYHQFKKDMTNRTPDDWKAVKRVLAEIEEWQQ